MHINTHILSNGLPIIQVDTKSFSSVTIMLLVGAGSRYENSKNNGVSHFFEHMAFKGSAKYKTAFEISSKIDSIGGIFNAFTSKDHTGYYIKAPVVHSKLMINILSDMLLNPNLNLKEIEKEKKVIIEEINMYEDMPARKVSDVYDDLVYENHPLSFGIAGTKETVTNISRNTITEYLKNFYHPKNAVLVMAGGGIIPREGLSLTRDYPDFRGWGGSGTGTEFEKYKANQTSAAIRVLYKKTEQAHFALGYRMFSQFDDRRYALSILGAILGGGMSSRLFSEVREKRGLCYYVSTGKDLYSETGTLVTQAGVTNNKKKLNEAIKVILHEHEQIASGNLTDEEISRAKEMLKGRLILSLEDSQNTANLQGVKYLFEKNTIVPSNLIKKIDDVTKKDIEAIAREFFHKKGLNIAVVGPYREEDITL